MHRTPASEGESTMLLLFVPCAEKSARLHAKAATAHTHTLPPLAAHFNMYPPWTTQTHTPAKKKNSVSLIRAVCPVAAQRGIHFTSVPSSIGSAICSLFRREKLKFCPRKRFSGDVDKQIEHNLVKWETFEGGRVNCPVFVGQTTFSLLAPAARSRHSEAKGAMIRQFRRAYVAPTTVERRPWGVSCAQHNVMVRCGTVEGGVLFHVCGFFLIKLRDQLTKREQWLVNWVMFWFVEVSSGNQWQWRKKEAIRWCVSVWSCWNRNGKFNGVIRN